MVDILLRWIELKIVLKDGEIDFGNGLNETALYNFIMECKYIILLAADGNSKVITLKRNLDKEIIEAKE